MAGRLHSQSPTCSRIALGRQCITRLLALVVARHVATSQAEEVCADFNGGARTPMTMIPRFLVRKLTGCTKEFVSPSSIHILKTSNHLSPQYSPYSRFPNILGEDVYLIHCGRWISSLRGVLVRPVYHSRHCYRFSHQNYRLKLLSLSRIFPINIFRGHLDISPCL
ncbi:hypothetical protein CY34DRAFT_444977 [Suillus luteus UH-Slu-Lm8-n1]|uniref:Unplaced genomic scaffold CY34scaffold_303, whole genome shotgun sequence n=1 Tax=Suillus luteus UH-Slu-Lm8-n1 TaxID=930992 RepID=A0A0D0B106_9AGAM|nr:hypothetical protein CY34DRAFT_444977 [Suillus luteus UH-Slu-Lm8-n1]